MAIINLNITPNKLLLSTLAMVALAGCSETEKIDNSEFSVFDEFKSLDIRGEAFSCDELIETKVTNTVKEKLATLKPHNYTLDVLDYLLATKYKYSSCQKEIEEFRAKYCAAGIKVEVESHLRIARGTSYKFDVLCKDELDSQFKHINYKYSMPTAENRFLTLEESEIMFPPEEIKKITYSQMNSHELWYVRLHLENAKYDLYYGDERLWEKAKKELAEAASLITTSKVNDN